MKPFGRHIALAALGMLALGGMQQVAAQKHRAKICPDHQSRILINGNSNAAKYSCQLEKWTTPELPKPFSYEYKEGKIEMGGVQVMIPSGGFECNNSMMTRDFRAALGAAEYPYISLFFHSLQLHKGMEGSTVQRNVRADMECMIKGVRRRYSVSIKEARFTDDVLIIVGVLDLKMSDFGIEPPTAMFGMIKVYDELSIDFNLRFCRIVP